MDWRLLTDTEAVEYSATPLGFKIEVTYPFCGYVCLLHLYVTVGTLTFAHWAHVCVTAASQKIGSLFQPQPHWHRYDTGVHHAPSEAV